MSLALALAQRGRGAVEPNPMVGAVLVRDGVELARGWHGRFGGPHAEREALAAARAAGHDPRGATMYVTLEPCCHHGKTPPCTDAIIEAGIARVVVAMADPDEHVAGKGVALLREGGVEVELGACRAEAEQLLAAYSKLRTTGRPWVICKWAQTADGLLALPPGAGRWISGQQSRSYVHQVRGWCDGVLVGIGTVLADDPLLTSRGESGKQPARVVLDSNLRMPADCRLVRTAGTSPVIVAATAAGARSGRPDLLRDAGVEILELPEAAGGVDLGALLDELGRRRWTYLLAEGGRKVLGSFLHQRLADEVLAFVSAMRVPEGGDELPRLDIETVREELSLTPVEQRAIGQDRLLRYRV